MEGTGVLPAPRISCKDGADRVMTDHAFPADVFEGIIFFQRLKSWILCLPFIRSDRLGKASGCRAPGVATQVDSLLEAPVVRRG